MEMGGWRGVRRSVHNAGGVVLQSVQKEMGSFMAAFTANRSVVPCVASTRIPKGMRRTRATADYLSMCLSVQALKQLLKLPSRFKNTSSD